MSLDSQRQLRENVLEAQDFLRDLDRWRTDIKATDKKLVSESRESKIEGKLDDGTDQEMSDLDQADELRTAGNRSYRDGDYAKAIELYTQSLDKHRTAVCLANRGMTFLKIQGFLEAEKDCTEALSLDSTSLKAFQRRAVARKALGRFRDALEDEESALKLQPSSSTIQASFQKLLAETMYLEGLNAASPLRRQIHNIQVISVHGKKQPVQAEQVEESTPEVDGQAAVEATKVQFKLPTGPKTWAEFEATFKLLKNNTVLFADYLFLIPPTSLCGIFKASLTPTVLQSILETVLKRIGNQEKENDHWISFLVNLKMVQRFDMVQMCLTKKQKESLRSLFSEKNYSAELESKLRTLLKL